MTSLAIVSTIRGKYLKCYVNHYGDCKNGIPLPDVLDE